MSNYGPIVTAWTVEQAVRDTLREWIDTLLGEQERQSSGRWDLRQIRRPRSWFIHSEFHDIPEKLLPAIHVESASKDLDRQSSTAVGASFPMVVQGIVKSTDRMKARELNAIFEWACTWILDNKGDLGDIAAATAVDGARYDLIPPERDRTLMGFEIPIVVTVAQVHARGGGPAVPDAPSPTPLPETSPDDPSHLSTHITVAAVGADGDVIPPDSEAPDPTGANVSVLFNMATAVLGTSGAYAVRTTTFIVRVSLTCESAPVGSPLTVEYRVNGAIVATLTILAGTTTAAFHVLGVPVEEGDEIAVTSTSVGSSTAATGVVAQVDLND